MVTDEADRTEDEADLAPNGIEEEGVELDEESAGVIQKPFDPSKIRMELWSPTIDLLIKRIREKEIDLTPDFQRNDGIWSKVAQSRLIESILVRVPLPAFYMDATDEEKLLVVDGLQRLTTLKRFVIDGTLSLTGLEFLTDLDDCKFADLPRRLQRRIEETQVTVYRIERGSPPEVKFNIFRRINTGGLPLSPQEIRHALNQGPVIELLKQLAKSSEFLEATANGINDKRMAARETVLRFLSFLITPFEEYQSNDLDLFLNERMQAINKMGEAKLEELGNRLRRAMVAASAIFGRDAFRKRYRGQRTRRAINKALFEAWAVNLDAMSDEQLALLIERRDALIDRFMDLMAVREFELSVSAGTGDPLRVRIRFNRIRSLIQEVIA